MKEFAAAVGAIAAILALAIEGYRLYRESDTTAPTPTAVAAPCPQPAYHVRPAAWSPPLVRAAEPAPARRPEPAGGCGWRR